MAKIANILVILSLELKLLWILKGKSWAWPMTNIWSHRNPIIQEVLSRSLLPTFMFTYLSLLYWSKPWKSTKTRIPRKKWKSIPTLVGNTVPYWLVMGHWLVMGTPTIASENHKYSKKKIFRTLYVISMIFQSVGCLDLWNCQIGAPKIELCEISR